MEADSNHHARKEVALPGSRTFADLAAELGNPFCQQLERAFVQAFHASSPNSNRFRHSSLSGFLRWISQSDDPSAKQLKAEICSNGRVSDDTALREALLAWRARIRDMSDYTLTSSPRLATRRSLLDTVSGTVRRLADVGLWPHPGRIKGFGTARDQADDGPSLGELPAPEGPTRELSVQQIVDLNRLRLSRLREIAAATVLDADARIRLGRRLGRACQTNIPEDDACLAKILWPLAIKAAKPLSGDDPAGRECIAIIWAHSWRYRSGRIAPRADSYRAVLKHLGGSDHVREFIIPSGETMVAAQVVLLVDSGVNVSTCEHLPLDCFEAEVVRGTRRLVRISGVKSRARGRVVSAAMIDDQGDPLPVKDAGRTPSAVQIIEVWKDISSGFRAVAEDQQEDRADQLWIVPQKRQPKLLRPGAGLITHSVLFARFLERHQDDPILGGLRFSRRTIRKSYLQDRAARKNWSSSVVALLADHRSQPSTAHYLGRKWIRRAYDDLIRQFQASLQAAFEARIAGDEAGNARAKETGLGFVCLAPDVGPTPHVPTNEKCSQVEYCAGCSNRSFVPTEHGIRQVVLLNRSLHECSDSFEARNPVRWATIWMPYLALTEALLQLLRESHHRFKLRTIERDLACDLEEGRLQLLEPW